MSDEVYLHGFLWDETPLALLFSPLEGGRQEWVPRSQCEYIHKHPRKNDLIPVTICCSEWIAKTKNLPYHDSPTYPKT